MQSTAATEIKAAIRRIVLEAPIVAVLNSPKPKSAVAADVGNGEGAALGIDVRETATVVVTAATEMVAMASEPLLAAVVAIVDSNAPDDATVAREVVIEEAISPADMSSSLVPLVTVMSMLIIAPADRSLRREPSEQVVPPISSVSTPSTLAATEAMMTASSAVP